MPREHKYKLYSTKRNDSFQLDRHTKEAILKAITKHSRELDGETPPQNSILLTKAQLFLLFQS